MKSIIIFILFVSLSWVGYAYYEVCKDYAEFSEYRFKEETRLEHELRLCKHALDFSEVDRQNLETYRED